MATPYTGIKQVVEITKSLSKHCPECEWFPQEGDDFDDRVNHYLGHGFVLLHVGEQTSHDRDGKPWREAIAILGR